MLSKGEVTEKIPGRRIVLVGVGHTNAHVLKKWRSNPIADTELVCVSDHSVATYSGLLPAVLAGQHPRSAMEIDLLRLCQMASARLIIDQVTSIDGKERTLTFMNYPPIHFDVLSMGIGSVPDCGDVDFTDSNVVTIKPMQTFLRRLSSGIEQGLVAGSQDSPTVSVLIIGGGAAGAEIACCLPAFLKKKLIRPEFKITLVHRGHEILSNTSKRTATLLRNVFNKKGVRVITGKEVVRIVGQNVFLDDGQKLSADLVIWATGAAPPPLIANLDFPKDDRGFLLTDHTLRITSGEPIFVVGDTGTIYQEQLAKAGVYAVRQGPVLWENIQRVLAGKPLQKYQPQKQFLRLLNTGDGQAIAEWLGFSFRHKLMKSWKDSIDIKFMQQYQVTDRAQFQQNMQMACRGCAAKLGASELKRGLSQTQIPWDDAAVTSFADHRVVVSADYMPTPVPDYLLSGRIATVHALNDVWAMGAIPRSVVCTLVVPDGTPRAQSEAIQHILAGVEYELEIASQKGPRIKLIGGHTSVGPQAAIGLTVLGESSHHPVWEKKNARHGDVVFLTKPIGTGLLLAAHQLAECRAAWYTAMVSSMLTHSAAVVNIAFEHEVCCATDVSGFGLIGHLKELCEESHVSCEVHSQQVPILDGAIDLSQRGLRSSLHASNTEVMEFVQVSDTVRKAPVFPVLFDPQTAGGLLICLPQDASERFTSICREKKIDCWKIAHIHDQRSKMLEIC